MGEARVLYAIAESYPFDALLVRDMRSAVNSLLQLNLRRFRIPQKTMTRYSALDVMKQALELLFEFSPSEKNYREAIRTIQVYSEDDEEMSRTLRESFSLIANAVYNAFAAQRYTESLAPEILFQQGIPFEPTELQQSFRFVGVRPPEVSSPGVRKILFLDEGFEPYKLALEGRLGLDELQDGREEHWANVIEATLTKDDGKALIRAGLEHLEEPRRILKRLLAKSKTGKLPGLLHAKGIEIKVIHRVADINAVFGKR